MLQHHLAHPRLSCGAVITEGRTLRRLQHGTLLAEAGVNPKSSKKAAIYDGCNRHEASTNTRLPLILKEGSHLRRLQLACRDQRVPRAGSSKKAAIYDGCNVLCSRCSVAMLWFLKEGSHLRRLQLL